MQALIFCFIIFATIGIIFWGAKGLSDFDDIDFSQYSKWKIPVVLFVIGGPFAVVVGCVYFWIVNLFEFRERLLTKIDTWAKK